MALQLLWTLAALFSFLICTQSVGLLEQEISPSQGRYLHRTTQTWNKRTQTSMPRMGFELTIPVFKRAKTVHALDRAATVIGIATYRIGTNSALYSISILLCPLLAMVHKQISGWILEDL
jgi:hypothetical protein